VLLWNWLSRVIRRSAARRGGGPRRPAQGRLRSYRPCLEALEGRCLPSTVTNLNDAGPGSLRDAIAITPSGGTVDFQAGLTGTIILMTNELAITKDLTIAGAGADVITVSGNHAGRVFYIAPASTVNISGMTIANGWDDFDGGAGIWNDEGSTLTVSNCTLSGNSAGSGLGGGAILSGGPLTVTNCTLSGNSAGFGGGIDNFDTLTISNSTLSGNSAFSGGGISNPSPVSTLTVTSSTFSGNSAEQGGGGIENSHGTVTVTSSTFSGNSAFDGSGGGIFNLSGAVTVTNSTLSGNNSAYSGGGIFKFLGAVTVTNSTLSGNSAEQGGGIYNESGTLQSRNTIIAGNLASTAPDVSGNIGSLGHNLIGNTQGGSGFDPTDVVNVDPMLGPLQDNGGPTKTRALLAGSPALNAGDSSQLGVADQRGAVRAGGVNIGAYQASASAFVLTVPGTVATGMPFDVTVQAVDVFGQVAFGYRGTAMFSVTDPDPAVVLPHDYTFTADDPGTHTFTGGFTLITPGLWTLTVADLANGLSIDVTLTVNA
jgi:hypothetical protein